MDRVFFGFFYRIFYDDDIKTPLLLISGADLVYGICQYAFTFLLRAGFIFSSISEELSYRKSFIL